MKINKDFETVIPGPLNSLLEVVGLIGVDVRLAGRCVEGPVANGDTDMVEASTSNVGKVGLGVESGPVLLQPAIGVASILTESPLVNDTRVTSIVEEAWGNPRLCDKPSTNVDTTDLQRQSQKDVDISKVSFEIKQAGVDLTFWLPYGNPGF